MHANTVTCELEMPLANHLADRHLVNSLIKSLVCYMVSRLFDTMRNPVASFSVNASVSIHVSQLYNKTHADLKKRILRFSFGFGDLSIDLNLANAALVRLMQTCTSCSVEPRKDPRYLKSSTMLMGWSLITRWSTVKWLTGLLSRICSVF